MKLLLGSSNPAKLARLRWMLEGLPISLVAPAEAGAKITLAEMGSEVVPTGTGPIVAHGAVRVEPLVEEGDASLRANAEAKAAAWANAYELLCLATDGGLSVPALGDRWRPALTRRAAGAHAKDEERAAHLLRLMQNLEGKQRRAYLVEAAALAYPNGSLVGSWEARSDAWVVAQTYDPRGLPAGFWLPGVLLFDSGRRYGDLTPEERVAVDTHWGRLRPAVRHAVSALIKRDGS